MVDQRCSFPTAPRQPHKDASGARNGGAEVGGMSGHEEAGGMSPGHEEAGGVSPGFGAEGAQAGGVPPGRRAPQKNPMLRKAETSVQV